MIVIDHDLKLEKDTVFEDNVRVNDNIYGGKYILTVKGELICRYAIVKELNVSEGVYAKMIVARKTSARDFNVEFMASNSVVGNTKNVSHIEKIEW